MRPITLRIFFLLFLEALSGFGWGIFVLANMNSLSNSGETALET